MQLKDKKEQTVDLRALSCLDSSFWTAPRSPSHQVKHIGCRGLHLASHFIMAVDTFAYKSRVMDSWQFGNFDQCLGKLADYQT